jgi:hypothetical protein
LDGKTFTGIKVLFTAKNRISWGRWRSAKVPDYSTNPLHAYPIEERMKQLGLSELLDAVRRAALKKFNL